MIRLSKEQVLLNILVYKQKLLDFVRLGKKSSYGGWKQANRSTRDACIFDA